jgi:hypothetical protein
MVKRPKYSATRNAHRILMQLSHFEACEAVLHDLGLGGRVATCPALVGQSRFSAQTSRVPAIPRRNAVCPDFSRCLPAILPVFISVVDILYFCLASVLIVLVFSF